VPAPARSGPALEVEKSYGGVRAVDSVSLEVPRQGLFGLCGFNGAGKSTLFNLLAGSVRPDSGSVRIDGQDGWSTRATWRHSVPPRCTRACEASSKAKRPAPANVAQTPPGLATPTSRLTPRPSLPPRFISRGKTSD
jgi:ABC-type cobalamin/Fe3+-siderophores transport system ATPase subunit